VGGAGSTAEARDPKLSFGSRGACDVGRSVCELRFSATVVPPCAA